MVAVPRGNGHGAGLGTIESNNGVDPLVAFGAGQDPVTGMAVTAGEKVTLRKTGARYRLAAMQKH